VPHPNTSFGIGHRSHPNRQSLFARFIQFLDRTLAKPLDPLIDGFASKRSRFDFVLCDLLTVFVGGSGDAKGC
jgi:hypothetical protein